MLEIENNTTPNTPNCNGRSLVFRALAMTTFLDQHQMTNERKWRRAANYPLYIPCTALPNSETLKK